MADSRIIGMQQKQLMARFGKVMLLAGTLVLLALLSLAQPAGAVGAQQTCETLPGGGHYRFEIYRGKSSIGYHFIDVRQQGDETFVDVDINIKVKLLFLTAYRYQHQASEHWRGERLVGLISRTRQNGKKWRVNAEESPDGLAIQRNNEAQLITHSVMPTSYWRPDFVEAEALLSTQHGTLFNVKIQQAGQDVVTAMDCQVLTNRFEVRGDLDVDLWYDKAGALAKIAFSGPDGTPITYRRMSH